MPTFWDLPKPVRDKIYRLHLVYKGPLDLDAFKSLCNTPEKGVQRRMPVVFAVCGKIDREASHIFFGENTFTVSDVSRITEWRSHLWTRHANQIRVLILENWDLRRAHQPDFDRAYRQIAALKNLESLTVHIDEEAVLEKVLDYRSAITWLRGVGSGPQVYLHLQGLPGMKGFRTIRGLQHVQFLPPSIPGARLLTSSGSIPGGFLETTVKHEIMQSRHPDKFKPEGSFRLLDLPAEIRNVIYSILLTFPGVTYPTPGTPTSWVNQVRGLHKGSKALQKGRDDVQIPRSSLEILRVNRQIHSEAVKVFYHSNNFVFSNALRLHQFIVSLSDTRLDCITSISMFYSGTSNDGDLITTLTLVRRLPSLRKFHFLQASSFNDATGSMRVNWPCPRATKMLFSFRNLEDIKIRDLDLEKAGDSGKSLVWRHVDWQRAAFKHLNYALRLAQSGKIFGWHLFHFGWPKEDTWPATGDTDCGKTKGCSCGDNDHEDASNGDVGS